MMKAALSLLLTGVLGQVALADTVPVHSPLPSGVTRQPPSPVETINQAQSQAVGVYEGAFLMSPSGSPSLQRAAKLSVYIVNVRSGVNADGSIRVVPTLMSRFQLKDFVEPTDYVNMQGFVTKFGDVEMASDSSASPLPSPSIALSGTITGGQAILNVSNAGGNWGFFVGSRTSATAEAASSGDLLELRQRLLAEFQPVAGVYAATVDAGLQRLPAQITLSIADSGGAASMPTLVALYQRLDLPAGIGERQLSVIYDALTSRISGLSPVSALTSDALSFSGTLSGNQLDVNLRDSRGYEGELKATRKVIQ